MKKVYRITIILLMIMICCSCNLKDKEFLPQKHTIPVNPNLGTLNDDLGADSFNSTLDHTDTPYYKINDYYNMKSDKNLHILSHFKTYQQTTEYSCGCAAALTVLNHYGITDYDELKICDLAETTEENGTSIEGLIKFFNKINLTIDYHMDIKPKFTEIEDAEKYIIDSIDKGRPIMVHWVDWVGHWQTIIGIDTCGTEDLYDDVLIMADPYDATDHYQDGYYVVPYARFFYMWREGPCTTRDIPYEQPFITIYKNSK